MHRKPLLDLIGQYAARYPDERDVVGRFIRFIEAAPGCFERSSEAGHVTGSAFILSPDGTSILLALHAKLNKWVQLGGHADGDPRIEEVALREALEESGLDGLSFLQQIPLDLDIHEIPPHKTIKGHLHYDVRFLLQSKTSRFLCSNESLALEWVSLEQVEKLSPESGIARAVQKIKRFTCLKLS